jgi:cathepsin L
MINIKTNVNIIKCIILIVATIVNSLPLKEFTNFIQKFEKNYDHIEFNKRLDIFNTNWNYIQQHNKHGNNTYLLGLGPFADLTNDEFTNIYLNPFINSNNSKCTTKRSLNKDIPTKLDWRMLNAVTPIKSQNNCGSCWAFSSTGAIEGIIAIKTGKLVSLSEQELVDCSQSFGNNGCFGGIMPDAFEFVINKGGLCSESDYPYTATQDSCSKCKPVLKSNISGCVTISQGNSDGIINALTQQPISVGIQANSVDFQHYKSGIFNSKTCYTGNIDHGVLLVAYDSESLTLKNSWGSYWGDDGYITIARTNDKQGMCGVYMSASYPIK